MGGQGYGNQMGCIVYYNYAPLNQLFELSISPQLEAILFLLQLALIMHNYHLCIVSAMNGKALTMTEDGEKQKKMKLSVQQLTSKPSQVFQLSKIKAYYSIKHRSSGRVIDIYKEKQQIYQQAIGFDFHGRDNQLFILQYVDEEHFMIINVKSKLVLEIQGGINANGMAIVQNTKYKYLNQLWKFKVL